MDRIEHLIAKFREEHPELDAALLAEFAQHVRRVVADDIREEMYDGKAQVSLALTINGQVFHAKGPREYVDNLLANFQASINGPKPVALQQRRASGISNRAWPEAVTATPGFNDNWSVHKPKSKSAYLRDLRRSVFRPQLHRAFQRVRHAFDSLAYGGMIPSLVPNQRRQDFGGVWRIDKISRAYQARARRRG